MLSQSALLETTSVNSDARLRPLRNIVFWTGAGNAVYLLSQYAMLMVVARLQGTLGAGQFSIGLAIVTPLIVVSQMQLRQLQVTDVSGEAPFGAYLRSRVISTTVAVLAAVVIGLLVYERGALLLVVAFIAIAKGVESVSDILHGRLQRSDRMDLVAGSLLTRGIVSFVVFAGVLATSGSLALALAAVAGTCGAVLLLVDVPLVRRDRATASDVDHRAFVGASPWRLAVLAWPLTLSSGLLSLSANVPRYFLEWLSGSESVALYAVAMMPISLVGLFTGAVSQASMARAALLFQTGQRAAFRRVALQVTGVAVLAGIGALCLFAVAGEAVVGAFFGTSFINAVPMTILLAVGVAIGGLSAFGSTALVAARRFRLQLANVIIAVVVQIPLCFWLVRADGVRGAAWSEVIRYVIATGFLCIAGGVTYARHSWSRGRLGGVG